MCFSFKKNNNNAQGGGQSRASVPTVNSSPLESSNASTLRSTTVQNGSHVQPQLHGMIFPNSIENIFYLVCWFLIFGWENVGGFSL